MRARRLLAAVASLAALAVLAGCVSTGPRPGPSATPDTSGVAAELLPYYGQSLNWEACEGGEFDCTTVTAPRDWADPSAGDLELALIRHRPESGEPRGSLLTNPGGPGQSGYAFVRDAMNVGITQPLVDAYDVIGFDPRGVDRSAPVTCYDAAGMDEYLFDVPDAERGSAAWEDEAVEEAEDFADACEANSDGILPYISLQNTARDLDLLRAVLGDTSLNYLGFSWGTALGAVYADLFPERVGRMVLDGALDPSVPGSEVGALQAIGFETSLRAFFADCATQDDCPYRGTVDDMMADLGALLARLDRNPVTAGDGRELGADVMLTSIITALYSSGSWNFLRTAITAAEDGDATTAFVLADTYYARVGDDYRDNSTEAFTAYNCVDYPLESEEAMEAAAQRVETEAPTIAPYWFGPDLCESWPVAPVATREPVTAEGAAPILVVGSTGDPATPYEWAVALADELSSGVLVTRVGEGHTGFNQGSACVDDAVESYLVDGVVPSADIRCE